MVTMVTLVIIKLLTLFNNPIYTGNYGNLGNSSFGVWVVYVRIRYRYTSLYFMKKNHKNRNYHLNPVLSASVRILEDWIWWSWVEKSNVRCEWLSTYSMMMKKVGLNEALFTCWHCVFIWRRIVGFVWKIWWILNHDDERW